MNLTWTRPVLSPLRENENNGTLCTCEQHQGTRAPTYRATSSRLDPVTGVVLETKVAFFCTAKAAWLAKKYEMPFPLRAAPAPAAATTTSDPLPASKPPKIFPIPPGTPLATCSSCRANIRWIVTDAGKPMPVDPEGISHFATCPNANVHRKRK